jgi:hypothetical protein
MMTLEQIKALDKQSDPNKLLPTTVAFLKEMREVANFGRERIGLRARPWTVEDEARYPLEALQEAAPRYNFNKASQVWTLR